MPSLHVLHVWVVTFAPSDTMTSSENLRCLLFEFQSSLVGAIFIIPYNVCLVNEGWVQIKHPVQ